MLIPDFSKLLLDVSSDRPVPVRELLLEAFLPKWKDFAAQSIRLDGTLSKVDKLVQLAETETTNESERVLRFFAQDIQVV